jgi:hypothetical protein
MRADGQPRRPDLPRHGDTAREAILDALKQAGVELPN